MTQICVSDSYTMQPNSEFTWQWSHQVTLNSVLKTLPPHCYCLKVTRIVHESFKNGDANTPHEFLQSSGYIITQSWCNFLIPTYIHTSLCGRFNVQRSSNSVIQQLVFLITQYNPLNLCITTAWTILHNPRPSHTHTLLWITVQIYV